MPKVSIVMTTFNRPLLLANTLASIAAQEFKDYEVIVVDDGADGETEGVCQQYGARYFKTVRPPSEFYRNPARPSNAGIRQASGEIVILQNAECKHVGREVIQLLTDWVKEKNVVFARVTALTESGVEYEVYCGPENPRPFFFCGAIRRSWFEKLRGFDEDFVGYGYEDNDFAERLSREGVSFRFTNVQVHHQWHPPAGVPDISATQALFDQKLKEGTVRNLGREWGVL